MKTGFRAARAVLVGLGASVALAGCSVVPKQVAHSEPPPPPQRSQSASVGVGRAGPAIWQLRAGLNVAALTCRRERSVQRDYSRMLARHRSLFTAAYQAEQRRGGRGFDHQQTRLYNRFSNQRSQARFCSTAAGVAHEASAMDSAHLAPAAPVLLARLERGLR